MFVSAPLLRRLLLGSAVAAISLSDLPSEESESIPTTSLAFADSAGETGQVAGPQFATDFGAVSISFSALAPSGNWIDTMDRAAVAASFQTEFSRSVPALGWDGDRASCQAGTTSPESRDSTVQRTNWFRGMAGVPMGVTENSGLSAQAQLSALMMSESGTLSHDPDPSFRCYSTTGDSASGKSNLYLGRNGADAITGYMQDPGAGNASAGHRNWILHPTLTQIGTGDIPAVEGWAANTLYVIQDTGTVFGPQPALREAEGFVAWPPAGYVPNEVVFERWSLGLRDGDLSSAAVAVVVNGKPVAANIEHRSGPTNGAPFPMIVWNSPSLVDAPVHDTTVSVTVSNVRVNGQTTSFSYDTIIMGTEGPAEVVYDRFISQAYQDFLGRSATPAELTTWETRLNSGSTRLDFVNTLATSEEWTTVVVQNLYLDTLGRKADDSGAAYWAGRLRDGTSVASAASQFYGSQEYVASEGGTWTAWLTDLYHELMQRNPDQSGLGYWISQAEQRGSGDVAYDFYQSGESRRARVRELYVRFLGRGPDEDGLEYWAGVLDSGDDLALAGFLASSDEYFNLAG